MTDSVLTVLVLRADIPSQGLHDAMGLGGDIEKLEQPDKHLLYV